MRQLLLRIAVATALIGSLVSTTASAVVASSGSPGDETIVITVNDSEAGGSYDVTFELVFEDATADGTPVYIYIPEGALADESVDWINPSFDPNPDDEFVPCPSKFQEGDYLVTQEQINALGEELVKEEGIVEVDEAHFGPIGLADDSDPNSDALVVLVYNVQDTFYYDCAEDVYTAGYFAPEYITDAGMNVIVIDAFDWANRIGEQDPDNPDGRPFLYEGVIAHELEHLLMNYSDAGELSWVDEGLADFAAFLNGYPPGGSHITYHQVFHRETSLTRWGGGLENYGASFSFMLYLWEQAGGNGDGTLAPDKQYDDAGGDLLIKLIFEEQADGMEGIQNAIDTYNALPDTEDLPSAEDLFKDWVIALYADDESSDLFNFVNLNFGDPDTTTWTIQLANDLFFKNRGTYKGNVPPARFQNDPHAPQQTALPYGTSYETFRNPGGTFEVTLDGDDTTVIAPHTGDTHWYGGYESLDDNILDVDYTSGDTIDFWTWYFIEEGWDYGFVEALVDGQWVTVPLVDDADTEVTTDTNPHDNNEEGNGLTGTSGGAYFVDDPVYIHLTGSLPEGTTDVQFRYSTDAAYLDTGWFVDDVQIDGDPVALSSEPGNWVETTGEQNNNWVLQILSPCDLTPNVDSSFETVDEAGYLYRLEGDDIQQGGFSTRCMRSTRGQLRRCDLQPADRGPDVPRRGLRLPIDQDQVAKPVAARLRRNESRVRPGPALVIPGGVPGGRGEPTWLAELYQFRYATCSIETVKVPYMTGAAESEKDHTNGRPPGRPRDAAIDELVLRATLDLLAEHGMEATTIQAVSDRTGIARATIYLRWPGRSALILEALRLAVGRPPFELSGEIATDFERVVERVINVFSQPMFIAAMPTLMGAFLGAEGSAPDVTFDTLFPNRRRLIDAYQRQAAEQGYRTDVDATVVVDALLGGLFMHLITTGQTPTRAFGQEVVAVLMAGIRTDPPA